MDLEELKIVLSVQSDTVKTQIGSAISQLNSLNTAAAASSISMASSMGGMSNMFSNLAIGAALGKSIQSGVSSATQAVKSEMNNVTRDMQSSMSAMTQSINQEMQGISNRSVDINVNKHIQADLDTTTIKSNLDEVSVAMNKTTSNMVTNTVEIKNTFNDLFVGLKAQMDSFKITTNSATKPIGPINPFGPNQTSSINSAFNTIASNYQPSENNMHDEAFAFRNPHNLIENQVIRQHDRMSPFETIPPGPTPDGKGGNNNQGRVDQDNDVPVLTQIRSLLKASNNRVSAIFGSMQRSLNGSGSGSDSGSIDSNGFQEAFQKQLDCCKDVREELSQIRAHLLTNNRSGGSAIASTSNRNNMGGSIGMVGIGAMLKRYLATIGLGLLIKSSISDAMDSVESESLFSTVFAEQAKSMRAWSNSFNSNSGQQMYQSGDKTDLTVTEDLGVNPVELRDNVSMIYVMTKSMGIAKGAAKSLSQDMGMLAQDIASFYNIETEEAFEKLKSGLTGEIKPLKSIGILVNETMIKQYAYANGITKVGAKMTESQKVMARYGVIMRDTATAQGDLARTIKSPANQLRVLVSQLKLLKINLGNAFLPIVQIIIPILSTFTKYLNVVISRVAAFSQALFGTSAQTSNTAATANTEVAKSLDKVGDAANKAKGSLMGFDEVNKLSKTTAVGSDLALDPITDIGVGGGDGMLDSMSNLTESMQAKITEMAENVKKVFAEMFKPFKSGWDKYGSEVQESISNTLETIKGIFTSTGETLSDIWTSPQMQSSVEVLVGIFGDVLVIFQRIGDELVKPIWEGFLDLINPEKSPVMKTLLTILEDVLKAIKNITEYLSGDGFVIVEAFLVLWLSIWTVNKIVLVGEAIVGVITIMKGFSVGAWLTGGTGMIATFIANLGKIGGLLAGIGAWFTGIGTIIMTALAPIGTAIGGFFAAIGTAVAGVFTGIAAALGISVGAAVALVAAAVIAIIASIVLIVKYWDEICAFFKKTWEELGKLSTKICEDIKEAWETMIKWFSDLWEDIKDTATEFWNWLGDKAEEIWEDIQDVWSVVAEWFSDVWDNITETATEFWNWLGDIGVDTWTNIKKAWNVTTTFFSDMWDDVTDTGSVFWSWMKKTGSNTWDDIESAWDVTADFFSNIWDDVKDTGSTFWDWLKQTGSDTWDSIDGAWSVTKKFFSNIWDTVKETGSTFWEDLKTLGVNAWDGTKEAWDATCNFFSGIWGTVKTSGSEFWTNLKDFGINSWEGTKETWDTVENYFSGVWDKVKESSGSSWDDIKGNITGGIDDIKLVFNAFTSYLSEDFSDDWGNAWNGIVGVFENIFSGIANIFKIPLNDMIDNINSFIRGVNRIDIPDWVPGVGGEGFNIKSIPRLARGGIVDTATVAQIGEDGPEAIIPLENTSFVTKLASAVADEVGIAIEKVFSKIDDDDTDDRDIIINLDSTEVGRASVNYINKTKKRTGIMPIDV